MTFSSALTTPSFRLDGRRALVTGGSQGIGLGAAVALAEAGAQVTVVARSPAGLHDANELAVQRGLQIYGQAVDVTDLAMVGGVIGRHGPFDILVNNAGTNKPQPVGDVTSSDFDRIMNLNVRAAFFVTQAVVGQLVQLGRPGSIINITSQMGHVGAQNRSVYCASKHALEGLTKAMAVELAPRNIRVNSIAPTFVETAMTSKSFEDNSFRKDVLSKVKLGRLGSVADVMGAVVYLASDASSLVTGTSLLVDGGWTAD